MLRALVAVTAIAILAGCSTKSKIVGKTTSPSRSIAVEGEPGAVQAVMFSGKPGVLATASLVKGEESNELSLVIRHQSQTGQSAVFVENKKLNVSQIESAVDGSLKLISENRILTVVYRGHQYVISRFQIGKECDFNLLSAKGSRDGKGVNIDTRTLPLDEMEDSEFLHQCQNW